MHLHFSIIARSFGGFKTWTCVYAFHCRKFEYLCLHCEKLCEIFPVGFVLGFYVNTIVRRWWEQFCAIPWPDSLVLYINAYAHSTTDRARMQRRTFIRYVNLSFCLTTRSISSRARLRFPTLENLVTAGLFITKKQIFLAAKMEAQKHQFISLYLQFWSIYSIEDIYCFPTPLILLKT